MSLVAVSLDRWGAIWAIVAGIVGALLFLGGLAKWGWDRLHKPRLVIECGNAKEFDRQMVKSVPLYVELADGREVLAAHAKFLRVNEMRGVVARDVRAWITAVDPADPEEVSQVKLRWWDGSHSVDIVPNGHDYLLLHNVVITEDGHVHTTPTCFEHQSPIEIVVTLFVGDRRHSAARIEIQHAWPGLPLTFAMYRNNEDEPIRIPTPFPYPQVKKLAPHKSHWWSRSVA